MKQIVLFKTTFDRTNIDDPFLLITIPEGVPDELTELHTIIINELLKNREIEKAFLEKEELCSFVLDIPDEVDINLSSSFKELFSGVEIGEHEIVGTFLLCCDPQVVNLDPQVLKLIDIFTKNISNAIIATL